MKKNALLNELADLSGELASIKDDIQRIEDRLASLADEKIEPDDIDTDDDK